MGAVNFKIWFLRCLLFYFLPGCRRASDASRRVVLYTTKILFRHKICRDDENDKMFAHIFIYIYYYVYSVFVCLFCVDSAKNQPATWYMFGCGTCSAATAAAKAKSAFSWQNVYTMYCMYIFKGKQLYLQNYRVVM